MKRIITLASLLFLLAPVSAFSLEIEIIGSHDGPYNYANSGNYLFTVLGENDNKAIVQEALKLKGYGYISLLLYGKSDEGGDFPVYITLDDAAKSGQWATYTPVSPSIPAGAVSVEIYTVKGANQFAVYFLPEPTAYGTWNVENLQDAGDSGAPPTISHFTGFTTAEMPPDPGVPEPTTLILLGVGLIGLGAFRKRFRNKTS